MKEEFLKVEHKENDNKAIEIDDMGEIIDDLDNLELEDDGNNKRNRNKPKKINDEEHMEMEILNDNMIKKYKHSSFITRRRNLRSYRHKSKANKLLKY